METKIYYTLDYIGQNIKECQELEKQGKLEEAKNKEKEMIGKITNSEGIYIGYNLYMIGNGKVRTVKEIEFIKNKGGI
ncbi:MAG: hypothetical protein PHT94_01020 [Candidatus Nanoarchaeia archaeon]|nr:hypothetical protein [Candidatus Nanoarchaeia archaeon]